MSIKSPKITDLTDEDLRILAIQSQYFFNLRYFPYMMTQKTPGHLYHFFNLLKFQREDGSGFKHLVFVGARGLVKTSALRAYLTRAICLNMYDYILYGSSSKDVAQSALFDIATYLQSNEGIVEDFGQLFRPDASMLQKGKPRKTKIDNFTTANEVTLKAFTLETKNLRGFNQDFRRPDLLVFDDFENAKTVRSAVMTRNTLAAIKELLPAISGWGRTIWVCNHISDRGVVQSLLDMAERNPDWEVLNVAAIFNPYVEDPIANGIPVWPERIVCTIKEAAERNANLQLEDEPVISLEAAMENMKLGSGSTLDDFYAEYLNIPKTAGECLFDVTKIKLVLAKPEKEFKRSGFWKIWEEPNPDHKYAVGADTAEGVGRDHSTATIYDLTTDEVVANYFDNFTDPNLLAEEIEKMARLYNMAIINPEATGVGQATVARLKSLNYPNLYTTQKIDKITDQVTSTIGFKPNSGNKSKLFYQFKNAFESGIVGVPCFVTLKEMMSCSREFLQIKSGSSDILTRHLDLLTSLLLAYECKNNIGGIYKFR